MSNHRQIHLQRPNINTHQAQHQVEHAIIYTNKNLNSLEELLLLLFRNCGYVLSGIALSGLSMDGLADQAAPDGKVMHLYVRCLFLFTLADPSKSVQRPPLHSSSIDMLKFLAMPMGIWLYSCKAGCHARLRNNLTVVR